MIGARCWEVPKMSIEFHPRTGNPKEPKEGKGVKGGKGSGGGGFGVGSLGDPFQRQSLLGFQAPRPTRPPVPGLMGQRFGPPGGPGPGTALKFEMNNLRSIH